jgi:hydrogenase-4 component D
MAILIPLLILTPLLGAALFLLGVIPAKKEKNIDFFAILIAVLTLILAALVIYLGFDEMPLVYTFGKMPWMEGAPDLFGALINPLSILMLTVVCVIGVLVVVFSTKYMDEKNKEHPGEKRKAGFFVWLLLFIGSMIGIALSPNLLQFLIFWELTTICSAALIAFYETEKGFKAGFKALLMTHAPGLFFFVAVALLFVYTKSFTFEAIGNLEGTVKTVVILFLFIAAWAKSAQIPFYTWLPDAMEAPTPISAYLHAAAMVKAGVFLVARVVTVVSPIPYGIGLFVALSAICTMYLGLMFYFKQDDLKKLLAFSTITHLAYIFLGLGIGILGSKVGLMGGLLHLICHAFGKSILFLSVGAIGYLTGTRYISQLSGLSKRMPLIAIAFGLGVLSVTGIPPFACFWSKFYILVGAYEIKSYLGVILTILVLVESIGSFYWFLKIYQKVFLGKATEMVSIKVPAAFQWTLLILMVFALAAPFIGLSLLAGLGL